MMRKGLAVGLLTVLLLAGLALMFSQETGYGWGSSSVATYVNVTCKPVGGPVIPCNGVTVTVELNYADGSYVGTQQGTYSGWWYLGGTLSFYFGNLDQRKGFIVNVNSRSCSFPPKSWVWWNRVLRITINSKGELLKCEG